MFQFRELPLIIGQLLQSMYIFIVFIVSVKVFLIFLHIVYLDFFNCIYLQEYVGWNEYIEDRVTNPF